MGPNRRRLGRCRKTTRRSLTTHRRRCHRPAHRKCHPHLGPRERSRHRLDRCRKTSHRSHPSRRCHRPRRYCLPYRPHRCRSTRCRRGETRRPRRRRHRCRHPHLVSRTRSRRRSPMGPKSHPAGLSRSPARCRLTNHRRRRPRRRCLPHHPHRCPWSRWGSAGNRHRHHPHRRCRRRDRCRSESHRRRSHRPRERRRCRSCQCPRARRYRPADRSRNPSHRHRSTRPRHRRYRPRASPQQ